MAERYTPPESVRNNARRGLELREKYGRGGLDTQEAGKQGIGSGVARARDLASGKAVSAETIGRMVSFFARHEKNKDSREDNGEPGAGMIAWLLWGGDAGKRWAEGVANRMKNKALLDALTLIPIARALLDLQQPDPLAELRELVERAGARHSMTDNEMIQHAHDLLVELGAMCGRLEEKAERDYKKEYRQYHGKPGQVSRRASRNAARRKLSKAGRVHNGDGKDVDHKDGNPLNNSPSNLRARDKSKNRADNQ